MNFNLANVILFAVGGVLVYAAVKNLNPKDVVTEAFGGAKAQPQKTPDIIPPAPDPKLLPNQTTGYQTPYNPGYPVTSV